MRASRPILPPTYFLGAIVVMVALHLLVPMRPLLTGMARLIGVVPLGIGVGVILWADRIFKVAHTAIKPGERASVLVTWGPFRFSRNPMYAGMLLALAGVALALGSLGPWLVVPPVALILDRRFIRGEEAALADQFGPAYASYSVRVRRWI